MTSEKTNIAHSIHDRLHNVSRERAEDFFKILRQFANEGFLRRLQNSGYSSQFVLKGAFLLMQWTGEYRRSTKDIDMLVYEDNSEELIRTMITAICSVEFEQDGMIYDTSEMTIEDIRDDEEYRGLRAKFTAFLGNARIPLQIDMGFGDAVVPEPVEIEYPTLLNLPTPRLLSYPVVSVIAEKVEAMVDKGMLNSRMKDFYDVYAMSRIFDFEGPKIKAAFQATFKRRETEIPEGLPVAFTDEFAEDDVKITQWRSFINKSELTHAPDNFAEVISELRKFTRPIFQSINEDAPLPGKCDKTTSSWI
jgi:hypothetical protein